MKMKKLLIAVAAIAAMASLATAGEVDVCLTAAERSMALMEPEFAANGKYVTDLQRKDIVRDAVDKLRKNPGTCAVLLMMPDSALLTVIRPVAEAGK